MAFNSQTNFKEVFEEVGAYDHVELPKRNLLNYFSSSDIQIETNKLMVAKQYSFEDIVFLLKRLRFNLQLVSTVG